MAIFAPVIVAPVEGGQFAIVDGQHRTTAAMLRGQKTVPCQVVQTDRARQAAAYAAVNGNITKTTAQQLYLAKLELRTPLHSRFQGRVLQPGSKSFAKFNPILSQARLLLLER